MNKNSEAILIFCSHLCVNNFIKPLEPSEWSDLVSKLIAANLEPKDLLNFSREDYIVKLGFEDTKVERFARLVDRSGSISFEIVKYENMGIFPITRADKSYPKALKQKLGNQCPPLFYCAGDVELLNKSYVGYVGSRKVNDEDIQFTSATVEKTISKGHGVVTGGAKGIDAISAESALSNGGVVVEYLADSMAQKMKKSDLVKSVADGKRLLLSVSTPTAGFNVGFAMMRNKFIYAQADATIIARAEKSKGGTWAGATENLKKGWCTEYARNCSYPGNLELIKLGAIPIEYDWDGKIVKKEFDTSKVQSTNKTVENFDSGVQMTLFD